MSRPKKIGRCPAIFFDHIFLDRSRQSLPHEFSDAQISQRCNKRKLADIARRERDISRYLFASPPHDYPNLRRSPGADNLLRGFLRLLPSRVSNTDRPLKRNPSPPLGIAQVQGSAAMPKMTRRKLMPNLEHVTWSDPTVTPSELAISSRLAPCATNSLIFSIACGVNFARLPLADGLVFVIVMASTTVVNPPPVGRVGLISGSRESLIPDILPLRRLPVAAEVDSSILA